MNVELKEKEIVEIPKLKVGDVIHSTSTGLWGLVCSDSEGVQVKCLDGEGGFWGVRDNLYELQKAFEERNKNNKDYIVYSKDKFKLVLEEIK